MAKFARVLLDHATGRVFDYEIPAALAPAVRVGSRVCVPVRNRDVFATVVELLDHTTAPGVRPLKRVVGDKPALTPILLRLAAWIADYYCCPTEAAVRAALPEVIRHAQVAAKKARFAKLRQPFDPVAGAALAKRAPKQAAILERLVAGPPDGLAIPALLRAANAPAQALVGLEKRGLIEVSTIAVQRDPWENETFLHAPPLTLNPEQQAVFAVVRAAVLDPAGSPPLLLHGVTGSGKTEIYLQAIQLALDRGRAAIMLVPEISLTPQTVERLKSRFAAAGTGVAVLHSHLSAGERHDEWHRIRDGLARIVIGARSAVFAPAADVGLIVVDEEHEHSYKQEETPRYHGRDIAVVRAQMEGAAVLLGSATPAVESYHNARTGKYRLLRLTSRVDDKKMPVIRVVDLRQETIKQRRPAILSDRLITALRLRLERREQSILFLNRRGFATSVVCPACGHVAKCPNCSLALTFHRGGGRLLCHLCGHAATAPKVCPECRDPAIRFAGVGTEKVEEVLAAIFPKAHLRRMDADTMTRKEAYRETLGAFRAGKIDILVGTQMIAKGLHFPNVTLVGIVNADSALHLPDFRAGERTFQLLTQVAGRAGRGDVEGEVIIQSFTPFHAAIQDARHHDYEGFFSGEIAMRQQFGFPPFRHLVLITVRCPHEDRGRLTAETLARQIRVGLPRDVELIGPVPAPVERAHGQYRFHLSLRTRAILRLSRHLRAAIDSLPLPEDAYAAVDVDPYHLL